MNGQRPADRRLWTVLVTAGVAVALGAGSAAAVGASPVQNPSATTSDGATCRVLPWLSWTRHGEQHAPHERDAGDAARCRAALHDRAEQRRAGRRAAAARLAPASAPSAITEDEPPEQRGSNDTLAAAQPIPSFGADANPRATVSGALGVTAQPDAAQVDRIPPTTTPDNTLAQARDTGMSVRRRGFRVSGTIDPTPAGSRLDTDFYRMRLNAGDEVRARVTRRSGDLIPRLIPYQDTEEKASLVPYVEDDARSQAMVFTVPRSGVYHLAVWPGSAESGTGWQTPSGGYDLVVTVGAADRDVYAVRLNAGDVLGAATDSGGGYVGLSDPGGTLRSGSVSAFATDLYPTDSPLPGGTDFSAATELVARTSGTYYVQVMDRSVIDVGDEGRARPYTLTVEVYPHGGPGRPRTQRIYLDVDGQRVNPSIWGGAPQIRTLSPLRSFLGRWGLTAADEAAVVAEMRRGVQENLRRDLEASGISDHVSVAVSTSADGPDISGRPGVSRVIVGGTIAQAEIDTIGVAQFIDPGNFDREDQALVLLDALSEPGSRTTAPYSLNTYLTKDSDRVAFVGRALAAVVSHEVGHLVGNWHTENLNDQADIMDAGGANQALFFGVGPDGVGGTEDDSDVDLGEDDLLESNALGGVAIGLQDTLSRTAWGMSAPSRP
ncbi:MAG: hypothetical protein ACRC35_08120 [Angustibacter sp.]